jgi:hypothetical protein
MFSFSYLGPGALVIRFFAAIAAQLIQRQIVPARVLLTVSASGEPVVVHGLLSCHCMVDVSSGGATNGFQKSI